MPQFLKNLIAHFRGKPEKQASDFPPLLPVYARAEVYIERGEGCYLYDESGKKYLDFAAGVAVNALGHCHPHVVKALMQQAGRVWHTANLYRLRPQEKLAERLVQASFADSVFFCSSGAEAVECGLKMVRKYHDETGNPGRWRVITAEGSFHGRTLATIAAGRKEKLTKGFEPLVDGFDQVKFNDIEAIRKAITPETGAVLLEPILGEGGIYTADPAYLQAVRKLCDEKGLLLFLDEVQCGMGRTGTLFYHEQVGIEPDICAVAKGIGSGFPLGACLAKEHVAKTMNAGSHGSTYGGNLLGMAVGNAVLDIILAEGFMDHVEEVGETLKTELADLAKAYPSVLEGVRGIGLMLGLVTKVPVADLIARLRSNGLLAVAAGEKVVRILPPLIIEETHIHEASDIIERTCKSFA